MYELIKVASNGQWKLEKANKVTAQNVGYGSTWPDQNKNTLLTGKDAQHGIKSVLKQAIVTNTPVRHMPNLATGKTEPHILLNRGLYNEQRDIIPNGKDPNTIHWTDDHKYISHEGHAIHALGDANGAYAQEGYSKNPKEVTGKSFSFWVPVSHIVSNRPYVAGKLKDTTKEHIGRPDHAPPESSLADELTEGFENHIIVKPGKYRTHRVKNYNGPDLLNESLIDHKV